MVTHHEMNLTEIDGLEGQLIYTNGIHKFTECIVAQP